MTEHGKVEDLTPRAKGSTDGDPPVERLTADAYDAVTLFDADGVDGPQYWDTVRRATPAEPERRLLLAILEDALACYRKNSCARTAKKQTAFREAEEWIFARDDERFLGFESICTVLAIEPSYLRRGLLEWKSRKAKASAPAEAA